MSTGKKPDPQRKKSSAPHSTYLKVDNGKKVGAYLAGELYGCYTHRTHSAQPCVSSITDDVLTCALCAGGLIPEWRGYVPLWDADWTLRHVLINEEYYESVNAISFRAKVAVSRDRNKISPLVIREEVMLTREIPNRAPWAAPVKMLSVCLVLWKNAELSNYFAKFNGPSGDELVAREGIAVKDDGKPYSAPMQGAAKRAGAPVVSPLDADYERIRARLTNKAAKLKPSANGDGKHD